MQRFERVPAEVMLAHSRLEPCRLPQKFHSQETDRHLDVQWLHKVLVRHIVMGRPLRPYLPAKELVLERVKETLEMIVCLDHPVWKSPSIISPMLCIKSKSRFASGPAAHTHMAAKEALNNQNS